MHAIRPTRLVIIASLLFAPALIAQVPSASDPPKYVLPPKTIVDVFDAELLPGTIANPNHQSILLTKARAYPTIAEMSQPMLRLAGARINAKTNGPFRNSGLPGTSGFVGEFIVVLGSVKANFWYAFAAASTLIWGAAYTLWMYKRVIFGGVANDHVAHLRDINLREFLVLGSLAVVDECVTVALAVFRDEHLHMVGAVAGLAVAVVDHRRGPRDATGG